MVPLWPHSITFLCKVLTGFSYFLISSVVKPFLNSLHWSVPELEGYLLSNTLTDLHCPFSLLKLQYHLYLNQSFIHSIIICSHGLFLYSGRAPHFGTAISGRSTLKWFYICRKIVMCKSFSFIAHFSNQVKSIFFISEYQHLVFPTTPREQALRGELM